MKKGKKEIKISQKINWKVFVACLAIVYVVAFIGSRFTIIGDWYQSIKPSITPPSLVFPIVWNILFFLIAVSLYFAWTNSSKNEKKVIVLVYGLNFILNILWSFLFFWLQRPNYAYVEIWVLWLSIGLMIYESWKINKKASLLLVPYFMWVSFAIVLNHLIVFK